MSVHGKNFLLMIGIGVLVFLVGSGFQNGLRFDSFNDFITNFSFYQLYSFVLGYSNLYFFKLLERINWGKHPLIKRISVGFGGAVLITLFGLFILRLVTAVLYTGWSVRRYWESERIENLMTLFHTPIADFN